MIQDAILTILIPFLSFTNDNNIIMSKADP